MTKLENVPALHMNPVMIGELY